MQLRRFPHALTTQPSAKGVETAPTDSRISLRDAGVDASPPASPLPTSALFATRRATPDKVDVTLPHSNEVFGCDGGSMTCIPNRASSVVVRELGAAPGALWGPQNPFPAPLLPGGR